MTGHESPQGPDERVPGIWWVAGRLEVSVGCVGTVMPVWFSVVFLALGPVCGPVGAAGRDIYSV